MKAVTLALLAFACASPAAALAQSSGNSGIDQYQENLPGAGGDRPSGPGAPGGGNGSGNGSEAAGASVSPATMAALRRLGPDGKGAAALAGATAPERVDSGGSRSSSGRTTSGSSGQDDGPGMGWVLPAILALSAAGALAVAIVRRSRGTPSGAA
jgi:hypothetical protein